MLVVANGRLITRDPENPYIEDGAVAIEGTQVAAVGTREEILAAYPDAELVDAHNGIIMPGLVNVHTHIYSGLARGLAIKGCDPRNFLDNLEMQWWNIDRHLTLDGTRACAWATIVESIRNGVSTIFDHHASYCEIPGSLFAIKDVCQEAGIRACLCYEVSDRDGQEKCDQGIQENADFANWVAEQSPEDRSMIAAMFGGHATFTLSDETMDKMREANTQGVGYHIHVAEGMNDVYDSLENQAGIRPVERLLNHGLLGPKTMLGHCIHVSPAEMDILAETGTMVENNPASNMNNAVGCAPVLEFFRRGLLVGLGTDAYTHDMIESLKDFIIIQRHNAAMPNVGWVEDMTMLFKNNPIIAEKSFPGTRLGMIAPGATADVVTFDYNFFTPFSDENVDGHILFGLEGRDCRNNIINGQLVYKDREFTTFDLPQVTEFMLQESKKLWGDLNDREY